MYLSHFGLSEQPFAPIPVTHCFYDGASRGVTLDALIYMLTHGEGIEGIIKVTGKNGSGKTTLCQLLMRRLPATIKTIYLGKPNLSQEELFHCIADTLKFKLSENCTAAVPPTAAISELQNALIEQYASGKQIVLLLDDAHTLPAETLEALRLLYELESSRQKSLQIVLFGQAELKNTLALPQLRQFRNRITHHFATQPFNAKAVKDYLIFRMRAAGYRGPDIFTPEAVSLITMASGGLAQQINNLADKSLLAAFSAHTRNVEAQHVEMAIKDSGIKRRPDLRGWSHLLNHWGAGASAVLAVIVLGVLGWQALRPESTHVTPTVASVPGEVITSIPVSSPNYPAVTERAVPSVPPPISAAPPKSKVPPAPPASLAAIPEVPPVSTGAGVGTITSAQGGLADAAGSQRAAGLDIGGVKLAGHGLLEQRVDATKKVMVKLDNSYYSIQLFATENIQPDRMERFLGRAQSLINLSDLYVHAVDTEGKAKFRVTYGVYPSREEASAAMDELPQKYKTSFNPELYTLGELR
ncbi:Type II secretory pathway, component ExeA (predicted ATPase) [Nitrosospira sp. Nl5]|uniref:AAA family ATPase n=1 Tax=Nitrosospira sp. Nl5 TaxID=200120 RepID=UPI00088ED965|nr:AAA family ATPase [Nitrosospira sp. Nl5]SCY74570.1 Type II secretory pathway, component ExeA (predicted ATPase) [Nitrosospira sp. Nl5]